MTQTMGFILFNGFEDLDFFGPWEMFALWSLEYQGPERCITIAQTHDSVSSIKGLKLTPDFSFQDCPDLDYLLIPGGMGTRTEVDNPILIDFIIKQAKQTKNLISVCTGAFLLQKAGLLHNKKATTHWASMDRLRAFKDIDVLEQRYVRDGSVWTSAGISAGIDMALAFIAETAGEAVAAQVQLHAEYYPEHKIYHNPHSALPKYVKNPI